MVLAACWGSSRCAEGLGMFWGGSLGNCLRAERGPSPAPAVEVQRARGPLPARRWPWGHAGGPGRCHSWGDAQQDLASGAVSVARRRRGHPIPSLGTHGSAQSRRGDMGWRLPPLPAMGIPVPPSSLAAASPARAGGRPRWEGAPPPCRQHPRSILRIPLRGAAPLASAHSAPG